MIIYLGGQIQLHNLEIKTQEELDEFNKGIKYVLEELLSSFGYEFITNFSVNIEWEEKAGELE